MMQITGLFLSCVNFTNGYELLTSSLNYLFSISYNCLVWFFYLFVWFLLFPPQDFSNVLITIWNAKYLCVEEFHCGIN